jgi:4-amino-4-deoxy-L-arabinose transferase-like glycosyltransferase
VLIEGYPLLIILIGAGLVAFSLGPFNNWDTSLEFEAASNTAKMGFPYVQGFGTAIDQPPLGFYVEALAFALLGLSESTSVMLVTFFGLGTVALVYVLGRAFYGKLAGFLAAALFALNPWHLVISRSGLIDAQCLFFSLLCLIIGVMAVRRGSTKLALASGLVFAGAFLTKFYAVFVLIPLLLFFVYSKPKKHKFILRQIVAFAVPVLLSTLLWYQVVLGHSILSIFHHNDFLDVIPAAVGVFPSPFFASNFLVNYGLGLSFVATTIFSFIVGFSLRKKGSKPLLADFALLSGIVFAVAVNIVLGVSLNLNVPYFSAFKYLYQALPFFALLVGSLIIKCFLLFGAAKSAVQPKKLLLYLAAAAAAVLIVASLLSSMYYTNVVSTRDYLQYRVEPQVDYGYTMLNPAPLTLDSPFMGVQMLGFAVVLSGLLLAVLLKFGWLSKLRTILEA